MSTPLVSLLDMLKIFATPFYRAGECLESLRIEAIILRDAGTSIPPEKGVVGLGASPGGTSLAARVQYLLQGVESHCQDLGFVHTAALASQCAAQYAQGRNSPAELQAFIQTVGFLFKKEIEEEWFLRVDQRRRAHYDNDVLFGTEVHKAFPSARPDLREAGNCLAADCNTAAVFHLMRAVEWGLRALCVQMGFQKLRTKNKRTGKVTYRLLAYTEWETILNQLQERVDDKINKVRRGPQKQLYQEFYYPALQDIRGIRDAWRNHTMHTRREYRGPEADAILDHVRRLMVSLASRVAEV